MGELQEIRRFWPWMRPADWFGDKRAFWARTVRGVQVTVGEQDDAWGVSFFDDRRSGPSNNNPRNGNQFFTGPCHYGPTIAAAMAAAGFAQRPIGRYRETFNQYADRLNDKAIRYRAWHDRRYRDKPIMPLVDACKRHDDGTRLWPVFLESSQRPHKKVRLGKRGRRLAQAASIGEALDATKHWRGKRKHKEVPC